MMGSGEQPIYAFEHFCLDARRRLLSHDGKPVSLPPKVFDTLLYLVEHPGEVLDKNELMAAIWPDTIVDENNLNQAISTLRKALGERPGAHRFIVTEPRRGYRFVAAVTLASAVASNPEGADLLSAGLPIVGRKAIVLGYGLGALAVIVAVVFAFFRVDLVFDRAAEPIVADDQIQDSVARGSELAALADSKTIAVLPFDNLSAANDSVEFFADAVHNEILVQLAKIGDLDVVSRTSVIGYRDTAKNLREIAQELGVATILEGSVQRAGDTVRISVRLIDSETDDHLWAETYDFSLAAESTLAVQSGVAISVAHTLRATISPQELARLRDVPTRNALAYDYYLNGNELLFRPVFGYSHYYNVPLALEMYQRALEEDPEFALAAANLALAHIQMYSLRIDPTAARLTMAQEAAEQAFGLVPGLPEAHRAMGYYHYSGSRNFESALAEFSRAEDGMPGDGLVAMGQAGVHEELGRWPDAGASFDRAARIDPRNVSTLMAQVYFYVGLRDYQQTEDKLDRLLEVAPDHFPAHELKAFLGIERDGDVSPLKRLIENPPIALSVGERQRLLFRVAYWEQNFDQQLQILQAGLVDMAGPGQPALTYGLLYSLNGQPELASQHYQVAHDQLADLIATAPDNGRLHAQLGEALAGIGEYEAAVRAAKHAIEVTPPSKGVKASQTVRRWAILALAAAGAHDETLEELDRYLSSPGEASIEHFKILPRFNDLHDDRRFQELVVRYGRSSE